MERKGVKREKEIKRKKEAAGYSLYYHHSIRFINDCKTIAILGSTVLQKGEGRQVVTRTGQHWQFSCSQYQWQRQEVSGNHADAISLHITRGRTSLEDCTRQSVKVRGQR
jgi:hypothetical protein